MYIQHAFTTRAVMRIDGYLRSIVVKSYNRRKLMKRIILGAVILLVVLIAAIVACALISYHKQQSLLLMRLNSLMSRAYGKRTSAERARIIEDNDEALKERIRMISNAKSEIILSTFDFRSDDSGKLMLGAHIDAADRGVSVNVIVDGVIGFTKMKGNPDFKALGIRQCECEDIQ